MLDFPGDIGTETKIGEGGGFETRDITKSPSCQVI